MVKKNINLGVNIQCLNSICLVLLLILPYTSAQSDDIKTTAWKGFVNLLIEFGVEIVLLFSVISIFFIIRWLRILFIRRQRRIRVAERATRRSATTPQIGLDVRVIETFPVFVHPDVVKNKRNVLECALCLEIFRDGDALRILPCDHVFHTTDCIDYWLFNAKSSTCPVCRFNLKDNVPETTLNAGNIVIDVMEDGQEHSEMVLTEEVIDPNNNEMNPSQIN
ncbi:hypothetical protein MKW92_051399 [Papaver armeniacum]|nr:hypothetical protein MKW92_051399 [Papaver armeniacum]